MARRVASGSDVISVQRTGSGQAAAGSRGSLDAGGSGTACCGAKQEASGHSVLLMGVASDGRVWQWQLPLLSGTLPDGKPSTLSPAPKPELLGVWVQWVMACGFPKQDEAAAGHAEGPNLPPMFTLSSLPPHILQACCTRCLSVLLRSVPAPPQSRCLQRPAWWLLWRQQQHQVRWALAYVHYAMQSLALLVSVWAEVSTCSMTCSRGTC